MLDKFGIFDNWKQVKERVDASDVKIHPKQLEKFVHEEELKRIQQSLLKGDGKHTKEELSRFISTHRVNTEHLENEFFHKKYLQFLGERAQRAFFEWKNSSNPRRFLKELIDKGFSHVINPRWWSKPKSKIGKGRWFQNRWGGWQHEYKPTRSTRLKQWLHEADKEPHKVMPNMNKSGKTLNRDLTDTETKIAIAAKKAKKDNWWNWVVSTTNNFGRSYDSKRKGRPGAGGWDRKSKNFDGGFAKDSGLRATKNKKY